MPTNRIVLTTGQMNRLNVEVRGLSAACAEIERLVESPEATTMIEYRDDLTQEERALVLSTVSVLEQQVMDLAQLVDATPHVIDVRRHVVALLSTEWADLIDTLPDKLRRYGDMDRQSAELLQPVIKAMIDRLQALIWRLEAGPPR